jgi:6-phosphogluconolactonase
VENSFLLGTYSMPSPWAGAATAHGDGVVAGVIDTGTGSLRLTGSWPEPDPAFVVTVPGADRVWAVTEVEHGGRVVSWTLDDSGMPTGRAAVETGSDGPGHLTVDLERSLAYACHFEGGSLSVLTLDADGAPAALLDVIALPASGRGVDRTAARSRPHSTLLLGDQLLVADYGRDLLALYQIIGTGSHTRLDPIDVLPLAEGTGPRHPAHRPGSATIYVSNEKSGQVSVLRHRAHSKASHLELVQTVDSPGRGRAPSLASEIAIHPTIDVVYLANRRDDSLSVFDIVDDGRLRFRTAVDTHGEWPRHFRLTPDGRWLVLGNQNTDSLLSYRVDDHGGLTESGHRITVASPASIAFR